MGHIESGAKASTLIQIKVQTRVDKRIKSATHALLIYLFHCISGISKCVSSCKIVGAGVAMKRYPTSKGKQDGRRGEFMFIV